MFQQQSRKPSVVVVAALTVGALAAAAATAYGLYHARGPSTAPPTAKTSGAGRVSPPSASDATPAEPPAPALTLPPEPAVPPQQRAKAFELLDALKQQANLAFQESRYEDAIRRYQDCLEVTAALGAHDGEAVAVEQVVRANVVMALLRMQDYDVARQVATMLLQDAAIALPTDLKVKVLYRRGSASKLLGDREAALADFRAALHFSKDQVNPAVAKEIELLEKGR